MRTLVLTLLFLVLVVPSALAGGSSPDEPPQAVQEADKEAAQEAAPEAAAEAAPGATEEAPADAPKPGAAPEEPTGPIGEIHLQDGTAIEIMDLKRFGKYYIYVSGKLNGRSAMVISLTRLDDLRRWTGIAFNDQYTFTLVTKNKKELNFTDGHVYLGSDSTTDYSFIATNSSSYMIEEMSVKKSDVKLILFK